MLKTNPYLLFLPAAFKHYIRKNDAGGWKSYRTGFSKISLKGLIIPVMDIRDFNFQTINLVGVYCTGSAWHNVRMDKIQSVGSNFSFSRWYGCSGTDGEFYGAVMNSLFVEKSFFHQACFVHSFFNNCTFQDTDLTGTDFSYSRLDNVQFIRCRLDKATFENARCQGVSLKNCTFREAQFKNAPVSRSRQKLHPLLKLETAPVSHKATAPAEDHFHLSLKNLTMESVNKRFRELVKLYHPDKFHNAPPGEKKNAAEMFLQIQESYLKLCERLNQQKGSSRITGFTMDNLHMILKQNPSNDTAWYNLGIIYFRKMEYDNSIDCYEKALKINPSHTAARHNLKVTRLVQTIYESVSSRA